MPDERDPKHPGSEAETFRVIDRRLFTAEGDLRQDLADQIAAEAAKEKPPAKPVQPTETPSVPQAEAPRPLHYFQVLLESLARNAALMLGGYADPRTGQVVVDLDGARELVEMLEALRDKTRGNLAPEEDRMLSEILSTLKLSYLEVSKAATQAMHEKASGKS